MECSVGSCKDWFGLDIRSMLLVRIDNFCWPSRCEKIFNRLPCRPPTVREDTRPP